MAAKAHLLKTWPEPFAAICTGEKTFEVRSTRDRTFNVRDYLDLRCFDPEKQVFTGDRVVVQIVYILDGPPFLPEGLAVMGIRRFTGQKEREVLGAMAAFGEYAVPCPTAEGEGQAESPAEAGPGEENG